MYVGAASQFAAFAPADDRLAKIERPPSHGSPSKSSDPEPLGAYFNAVETDMNVLFKLLPRVCTVAMIAMEMPAASKPYSIAVAPD